MKRSVIIADDSKFLQLALQKVFHEGEFGEYEVLACASNGVQAVDLYRQYRPDLLTLDLTMPVMDGKAALTEILREFPAARVLIISALSGSTMLECIRLGAKGFVEKPLRFDDEEFRQDFESTLGEVFASASG